MSMTVVSGWCGSSHSAWRLYTEGQGLKTQDLKAGRLKEIDDVDKNTFTSLALINTQTHTEQHIYTPPTNDTLNGTTNGPRLLLTKAISKRAR